MKGYKRWVPQMSEYLARKQCTEITYVTYIKPVLILPVVAAPLRTASDVTVTAAHTVALAKYD
jgi:hypothetical protein